MDFAHREMKAVGKTVHRLGLATNYGIEERGVRAALDRGINFVAYWGWRGSPARQPLREAFARDRDRYVVAHIATVGFLAGGVRRSADKVCKELGTDHIDVLMLGWLGVSSALTGSVADELVRLRESGRVRSLGVSIHDRERAGRLAEDSILDLLMIRYNAAHPGAERDIFPHLARRQPSVIAYTATDWRKLLRRPSGWSGAVPTAGDCYRFCLSNPSVDLVLTGPADEQQLDENLRALDRGPLSDDEMRELRAFGKVVHG